jgi:hypothetical protein
MPGKTLATKSPGVPPDSETETRRKSGGLYSKKPAGVNARFTPRAGRVHSALCRAVYGPCPPKAVIGPTFTSGSRRRYCVIVRPVHGPPVCSESQSAECTPPGCPSQHKTTDTPVCPTRRGKTRRLRQVGMPATPKTRWSAFAVRREIRGAPGTGRYFSRPAISRWKKRGCRRRLRQSHSHFCSGLLPTPTLQASGLRAMCGSIPETRPRREEPAPSTFYRWPAFGGRRAWTPCGSSTIDFQPKGVTGRNGSLLKIRNGSSTTILKN